MGAFAGAGVHAPRSLQLASATMDVRDQVGDLKVDSGSGGVRTDFPVTTSRADQRYRGSANAISSPFSPDPVAITTYCRPSRVAYVTGFA